MGSCCSNPQTEQLLSILDQQDFDVAHQFFDSNREQIDPNYYDCPHGSEASWTIVSKLFSKTYREVELLEKFLFSCKCGPADPFIIPTSSPFNAIHLLLTSSATSLHQDDENDEKQNDHSPFVATNDDDDDDDGAKNNINNATKKQSQLTSPLAAPGQPASFIKSLTLLFKAAFLLRGEEKSYATLEKIHKLPSRSQLLYALLMVYLETNIGITPDIKVKSVLDFFIAQFYDFRNEVIHQNVQGNFHQAHTVAGVLSPSTTIFHVLAAKDKTGEIFDHVMNKYRESVKLQERLRQEKDKNQQHDVEMCDSPTQKASISRYIAYMMNDEKNETPTRQEQEVMLGEEEEDIKRLLFDSELRTPLIVACQSFNVEMIKKFVALKMGGDVRYASVFGANAFHFLATSVIPSSFDLSLQSNDENNNNDSSARFFSAEQENADEDNIVTIAAKAAKKARVEAIKNRQNAFNLHQTQSAELVSLLLGLDGSKFAKEAIDCKKYTPLLYAIQNQNRPLVKVLLEQGQVKKDLPDGFVEQNFKNKRHPKNVDEFSGFFGMLDLVGSFSNN